MDNIFIGWSGNQTLANALGNEINNGQKSRAIVGGGKPTDMFIGEQVLKQINDCDFAILLVEKKTNAISPNLMFEWGYLVAKLSSRKICTVLINYPKTELPSDVLGSWVVETNFDRETTSEEDFVKDVYKQFEEIYESESDFDYFSIISDWKNYFFRIRNNESVSDRELCKYIIIGCLAAYYYGDNEELKNVLTNLSCTEELSDVVHFAIAYINVFLDSGNMMQPLTDDQMYNSKEAFDSLLNRNRRLSPRLDTFLDILCHDAYGLACAIYLKNPSLDDDTKKYFGELAEDHLTKVLTLLPDFERPSEKNQCLVQLIKAYIYNDLSKLYHRMGNAYEKHLHYLTLSVNERKSLFQSVKSLYPNNTFLIEKMEQEYMIALSAQCRHMENPIEKRMSRKKIENRLADWEDDYRCLGSLIKRIEVNLALIDNEYEN